MDKRKAKPRSLPPPPAKHRTTRTVAQRVARARRKARQSRSETVGRIGFRPTAKEDAILARVLTDQHFSTMTDAIRAAIRHFDLHPADPGTLEHHTHVVA